jgi:AHBA synthesis associated protein
MSAIDTQLRCVVFDVDGVLLDSWPLMQYALAQAHATCGARGEVPVEPFRRQLGRPLPEIAENLGLPPDFVSLYQEVSRNHLGRAILYDGVRETLEELAAREIRLALNTSKDRRRTLQMLRHFQLEGCFDAVVTADDVERGKPDPESLHKALALTGVPTGQAVFVGDSPIDIECARAAGVMPVAATWGMGAPEDLQAAGARIMISNVHQLVDLVIDPRVPQGEARASIA